MIGLTTKFAAQQTPADDVVDADRALAAAPLEIAPPNSSVWRLGDQAALWAQTGAPRRPNERKEAARFPEPVRLS